MEIAKQTYDTLTLDWDYYMAGTIERNKEAVVALIKASCKDITIYETQKGANVICNFAQPVNIEKLLLLRLLAFDDLFRIRNEVSKMFAGQLHRINRIWLVKDGHAKTKIYQQKAEKFDLAKLEKVLEMIKKKRPAAKAKTKPDSSKASV